jgi:hypothetical protein
MLSGRLFYLLIFLSFFYVDAYCQKATITSFDHTLRWLSSSRFPSYSNSARTREAIFKETTEAIKTKLKVEEVLFPPVIQYKNISGFGKASLKKPASTASPSDYSVSILSFLTRGTTSEAVIWKMEAAIMKEGKIIYSSAKEHELEYFNISGYLNDAEWLEEDDFVSLFTSLVHEVFETGDALPEKILIGSMASKEEYIRTLFKQPTEYIVKSNGDFLGGGNFIMQLEKDSQVLTTFRYIDGVETTSVPLQRSAVTAGILNAITGINIGYTQKVKEKRVGRMDFDNGRKIRLKIEWMEEIETSTDKTIDGSRLISPVLTEAYEGSELVGAFSFHRTWKLDNRSGKWAELTYKMEGESYSEPITLEYDSYQEIITVSRDGNVEMALAVYNIHPDAWSFRGTKMSKNKRFSGSWNLPGKQKLKDPEWYRVLASADLSNETVGRYMEALAFLMFAIGNFQGQ